MEFVPDSAGRFVLPHVPAGRGEIVRYEASQAGRRTDAWKVLLEFEVFESEETLLDLR